MDIILVNQNFERLGIIDNASVIWNDRYYKNGEFEIYLPINDSSLELLSQSFYVVRDDDENNVGVIQDVELTHNSSNGDFITLTGKFATGYYFSKRVISSQITLYDTIPNIIRALVNQSIINPSDSKRKINSIKLGTSIDSFTEKINMQTTGKNLLEKISEICETYKIGFKMPIVNNELTFDLYEGVDRSYAQSENPYVVFSDEYDNLDEVVYNRNASEKTNFAYVAGEGEGINRKIVGAYDGEEPSGFDRNEIWVDQRNMSSNEGKITDEELTKQMKEEGIENLVPITESFEGKLLDSLGYQYGKDFFLGDIVTVQMKKWNGMYINARIVEVIESEDENGKTLTFTFEK